jgi:hypothetical protein
MYEAIFLCCIVGYIAFRNWLTHDKRRMIHRERMAAIEKGIPLPAVEQEVERRSFNVQRFLLLAGWSWIFTGIGAFIALSAVLNGPVPARLVEQMPPPGAQYGALIPLGIGIAHLITYWNGKHGEKRTGSIP